MRSEKHNCSLIFVMLVWVVCHTSDLLAEKLSAAKVFAPDKLLNIEIELADSDWQQIRRQTRPFGATMSDPSVQPFKYFRGTITVDGTKISSVGIRRKGLFGSQDNQRPSLKVKFDEFIKQDPAKGFDRLTLNNNKQDESQMSQLLAYRLFNAVGVPAPRVNFARVTVNGEYLGVYSNVESIRKPFLKKRFGDKSGNLYEGTLTDFYTKAIDRLEAKTNKKNNDRSHIKRLAELVSGEGEFPMAELEKLIELDSFIRYWAVESLIGFWDGYASNQNNFFVYHNPKDGKLHFLPWGADSTFTTQNPFSRFGGGNRVHSVYAQGMLTNRLFRTPGIADRYRNAMRLILEKHWNETSMLAEVDRVEKLLTDHLHSRQGRTAQAMNNVRAFIRDRRAVIESEMANDRWPVPIPMEPRKPTYVVEVGSAVGTFETTWSSSTEANADSEKRQGDAQPPGKAALQVKLDGKPLQFTQLQVSASPGQQFGGRGGFGGGFGRGGFGRGGFGAPNQSRPPAPATVVFVGQRQQGGPLRLALTINREEFKAGKTVNIQGSISEGERAGFGFGFRGPGRTLRGTIRLTAAGTRPGSAVAGEVQMQIVESRGGMFGGRGRGPGNFAAAPARPGAKERGSRLKRAIRLMRQNDANADGKLNRSEWKSVGIDFSKADADSSKDVSLKELIDCLAKPPKDAK